MADWRFMGQGARRRSGHPSAHSQGARNPSQMPRFTEDPGNAVGLAGSSQVGRPFGSTVVQDFKYTNTTPYEESASQARAAESSWARQASESGRTANHPSMRQRRMRPEGQYFG